VAHSTIKVYDTQMDSVTPILTFDPKDIGLEMRAKEPRVTAMGFRPSTDPIDQGRFLWCGNRDGHVWELDIQSGEITSVKPLAHSGPVTHIMAQGVSMVTLDEVGKMNIWETPEGIAQASYRVVRTQRLSDKVTFAKIIKGHLWAATAPAVRSATNTSAARGPTVRVYDLTIRQIPPPLMALTTEWTGAATSATVLPLDPDHVYMGHEGGFVTRWSIESGHLVCVQVLKVSSTDILSLEGVGDRLWAGNRRGQIHVWNTSERPWMTTNIWTAHT
jgi:hypothetical protein